MTKSRLAAIICIVLGIVVLAISSLLPALLPTHMFWTAEEAREQSTAASRLHQMTHEAAHTQESPTASASEKRQAAEELAAARARYEQSRSALDAAQFWRSTVPTVLRWTAAGLSAVGVLTYLSVNEGRD
jgi:hypothetical protein